MMIRRASRPRPPRSLRESLEMPRFCSWFAGVVIASAAAAQGGELRMPRHPSVSPDGSRLVFGYEGDVWLASTEGGLAVRVTASPAREGRAMFSPDGRTLVFESDRHGNSDLFSVSLEGGEPRRLTWHSAADRLSGFTGDGAAALFVSRRQTREGRSYGKLYRIPLAGGAETPVSELGLSEAALSSDGKRLAFVRGAESWWRKDYRGAANLDVWTVELPSGTPAPATDWDGNDLSPMWHPDGVGFYFLRERDRAHNVWWKPLNGAPVQVTTLPTPGVRFPHLNTRGTHLAFEAEDGAWILELDPARPEVAKAPPRRVPLRGFADPAASAVEETVSGDVSEFVVSRDDKTIAFVAAGEIWAMEKKAKEPRRVRRLTDSAAGERSLCFTPDGEGLLYVSDVSGEEQIWRVRADDGDEKRLTRARRFKHERLTDTPGQKTSLSLSPDQATLVYVRGLGDLVAADPTTLVDKRVVLPGFAAPDFDWSPDSRRLVVSQDDDDFNTDVWIVSLAGDEAPYNVSRHPDEDVTPAFDPQGRFVAFASREGLYQDFDLSLAWLRKADFEKTAQDWEDEEEAKKGKGKAGRGEKPASRPESGPAAESRAESRPESTPTSRPESGPTDAAKAEEKKVEPTIIEFQDLFRRRRRLAPGLGSRRAPIVSADGKSIAYLQTGPEFGLYITDLEGRKRDRVSPTMVSAARWIGDEVWCVSAGQITAISKAGGKTVYGFSGVRTRRPFEERRLVFLEAWRKMRDNFYDPALHGADWNAARARFEPWAAAASTPADLEVVVMLLLGELNGSHLGFRAAGGYAPPNPSQTAQLGVLWDESFAGPGLRVAEIVEGTPAAREKSRLAPGDVVLAVDDREIAAAPNPWAVFDRLAGRETRLRVKRGAEEKEIVLTPAASIADELYDADVERRRKFVHERTNGKAGYVHIEGMDTPELLRFEREIFAEGFDKSCLVIDVRGNGGGWTADLLFTMLTQAEHATTAPRGGGRGYPQDRRVFAAWTKPIVVLCDEFSYSNAEIFSWGVKTLKRGPVVGKRTYGAVISTGAFRLLDGSSLRNPFRGWYTKSTGQNMENNGCIPDVAVENLPHDLAAGRDAQLEAAVAEALKQLR
jgi:tricorn protease